MNQSIISLSGNRLRNIIEKSTSVPFLGVLAGTIVTALTQSSSGTTIMVVSFVNSGVMNLHQATAVIIGANIGTTFTGQLTSFDFYSMVPRLSLIGVLLFTLNINYKTRQCGKLLIGFSCLFLGIKVMIYFLDPLKYILGFKELILSVAEHKMKGIAVGASLTAIIQSSSTGIALIQGLAHSELLTLNCSISIMMGMNIGTCATTLISSITSDRNGKRAAIIHLLFNIIGVLAFYPFLNNFTTFIYQLTPYAPVNQISNAHTLFNIANALLLFPFISLLVYISKKIIR